MNFGLKNSELQAIVDVIKTESEVEKAVIFGSRARGDYQKTSDIDIAIYGPKLTSLQVNLLRDRLNQLDMIYKIDVVDVERLARESLIRNIENEGRQIFPI